MGIITIIGKPFKEKRLTTIMKKVSIYPTNHGNLTAKEMAEIEGIKIQTVRNKICRGLYDEKKRKLGRPFKITEENNVIEKLKKSSISSVGSWEQEQLNKEANL